MVGLHIAAVTGNFHQANMLMDRMENIDVAEPICGFSVSEALRCGSNASEMTQLDRVGQADSSTLYLVVNVRESMIPWDR